MFPLEQITTFSLGMMLWGALVVPLSRFCMMKPMWFWAVFAALCAVAALLFADPLDKHWEIIGDLLFFGCVVVVLVLALGVGWALHAFAPRVRLRHLVLGVSLPLCLAAAVGLWVQRVPNAACATDGVELRLAGQTMFAPANLSTKLWVRGIDRQLSYQDWRERLNTKPDVRTICHKTKGGTRPMGVTSASVEFWPLYNDGKLNCPAGKETFCQGLPLSHDVQVQSVTVFADSGAAKDATRQLELLEIDPADIHGTLRDGSICYQPRFHDDAQRCMAWRYQVGAASFLARSRWPHHASGLDPHDNLRQVLDWAQARMRDVE